ncbi:MAG: nickel pincer cofactor biosynthesis protein LarB [Deltaproteobacteria bacterium]|nr:nickel pincer cofactor biosynthesis protein LarB [Deltaproteobacteria bacterium]
MEPFNDSFAGCNYIDLNFAKLDIHRLKRAGKPEAVLCDGKTAEEIFKIAKKLENIANNVIFTRVNYEIKKLLLSKCKKTIYYDKAKIIILNPQQTEENKLHGNILIVTAGTADISVAEEAAVTASILGNKVSKLYDIGVAGSHRLFDNIDKIKSANVIIAVAGMDGVLPTLISSLVDSTVIAVPSSNGYGTGSKGISALLSMLNSCSGGLLTVNIDNGFGAGLAASIINKKIK